MAVLLRFPFRAAIESAPPAAGLGAGAERDRKLWSQESQPGWPGTEVAQELIFGCVTRWARPMNEGSSIRLKPRRQASTSFT